jgi:hypothetical protein
VSTIVVVSPASASWTVTPTMAPVARFTACSAVCARCVRPSFVFVIFASGSCGLVQSSFDPFFFRVRSNRASSARVGVAMPDASASRGSHGSYASPVSRRTMLRIAGLASSVVASIPIVPLHQVGVRQPLQHPREHRLVRLDVDQPARARQGRMVWRRLVQREVQELPDAQRIGRAPRDGPLRVHAFKIAEQQQSEIAPRRQTRPPDAVSIERRALRLDKSRSTVAGEMQKVSSSTSQNRGVRPA